MGYPIRHCNWPADLGLCDGGEVMSEDFVTAAEAEKELREKAHLSKFQIDKIIGNKENVSKKLLHAILSVSDETDLGLCDGGVK